MSAPASKTAKGSLKSWLIVLAIAVIFTAWGLFIFFAVGDKGNPPWDYGVIEDIPGQSPYSTVKPQGLPPK